MLQPHQLAMLDFLTPRWPLLNPQIVAPHKILGSLQLVEIVPLLYPLVSETHLFKGLLSSFSDPCICYLEN